MNRPAVPIETLHLFPVLNDLLVDLLKSLSPEDWDKPTLAPLWTVKDIAAHLLDTNMRAVSAAHGYSGKPPQNLKSYKELVDYLNALNADWVKAMDRVSPQQLINMLEISGPKYVDYLKSLDPFAPSKFSVAWAGEEQSANWFHIAREYTEKWHHQQQIREAVNKPGLMSREFFYPCIDTFMRGLPYAYRNELAAPGTLIKISVSGHAGGVWYLLRKSGNWELCKDKEDVTPDAAALIDPEVAWKVFTKGLKAGPAKEKSILTGDIHLAEKVFDMIAVMA